jgi:hypothetical protein
VVVKEREGWWINFRNPFLFVPRHAPTAASRMAGFDFNCTEQDTNCNQGGNFEGDAETCRCSTQHSTYIPFDCSGAAVGFEVCFLVVLLTSSVRMRIDSGGRHRNDRCVTLTAADEPRGLLRV